MPSVFAADTIHSGNAHQQSGKNGASFEAPAQFSGVVQLAVDPQTKEEALERHQHNQQRVYNIIDTALHSNPKHQRKPSREKLLHNTAELIRNQFMLVYVLSRTHAAPAFRENNTVSYFDRSVRYPNMGGDYGVAPDQRTYELEGTVAGHADHRGEIRMYDPSELTDEDIYTILIHETQHQADFHRQNESFTEPALDEHATQHAVNGYKTEFRAYWVGGLYRVFQRTGVIVDRLGYTFIAAKNETKVPSGSIFTPDYRTHFRNQRQENIFWHMINSGSYQYILTAYQNSQAFRDMVDQYTLPVGGNLLNSARIEALRSQVLTIYTNKIHILNTEQNDDLGVVEKAKRRINYDNRLRSSLTRFETLRAHLDAEDVEFLVDHEASAPFWNFVTNRLGGEFAAELLEYVSGRSREFRHEEFMISISRSIFDRN